MSVPRSCSNAGGLYRAFPNFTDEASLKCHEILGAKAQAFEHEDFKLSFLSYKQAFSTEGCSHPCSSLKRYSRDMSEVYSKCKETGAETDTNRGVS